MEKCVINELFDIKLIKRKILKALEKNLGRQKGKTTTVWVFGLMC